MKTYEEMAKDVLCRIDEYNEKRAAARKRTKRIVTAAGCCCLIAAIGFGAVKMTRKENSGEEAYMAAPLAESEALAADNESPADRDEPMEGPRKEPEYEPAEIETGDPLSAADPQVSMGWMQRPGDPEPPAPMEMISSYKDYAFTADVAVDNGCSSLSGALAAAVNEYGDSVLYRVAFILFRDGVDVSAQYAEEESKKLASRGYTTAYEVYNDGYVDYPLLTIHATAEQLKDFKPDSDLGYLLCLYEEVAH